MGYERRREVAMFGERERIKGVVILFYLYAWEGKGKGKGKGNPEGVIRSGG